MSVKSIARLIILLLSTPLFGAAGSAQAADAPTAPIPANMVVKLRANLGKTVTVRGRVAGTGRSPTGYQFLNFAGAALTAVCEPEHAANFRDGQPAEI